MENRVVWAFVVALSAMWFVDLAPTWAQGSDPTSDLVATLEEGQGFLWNLISVVGGTVGMIAGLFCYMGWLPKDYLKTVLIITGLIILAPQVIKFMFDTAGASLGAIGTGLGLA